jgi:hypothetical protein
MEIKAKYYVIYDNNEYYVAENVAKELEAKITLKMIPDGEVIIKAKWDD